MESTNNLNSQHHHQLQDHLARSSVIPSSLGFPSFNVVDNEHAWRPVDDQTLFLSNNIHATNCDEASPNSFNNSMIQDLRFSLPNNINIIQPISSHHHEQHSHLISNNKIKEESSTSSDQSNSSSFQTFGELLSPSTNTPSEMLLLNTLSPTYKNHMLQPSQPFQPSMQFHNNNINNNNNNNNNNNDNFPGVTTFSHIFPSVNISKLSSSTINSTSNFRGGLDLFSSESILSGGSLDQAPNSNFLELFKGSSQYGIDHDLQHSNDLKLCNSHPNNNYLSSFNNNGVLETKRPSCIVEPKSTYQSATKKQRFETTRASCPPFKVRKEKLGDRIAALQQLVAPFGKTDTASVLMEAIGYIKFLQNQIQTLSVPYMKLGSRNKSSNNTQKIPDEHYESEGSEQDLRSRGLCLVPLTCVSYITNDFEINGVVWPPPHSFNPGF